MVMLRNLENWAGKALDLWRVEVAVSVVVFPVNFEHRTCRMFGGSTFIHNRILIF